MRPLIQAALRHVHNLVIFSVSVIIIGILLTLVLMLAFGIGEPTVDVAVFNQRNETVRFFLNDSQHYQDVNACGWWSASRPYWPYWPTEHWNVWVSTVQGNVLYRKSLHLVPPQVRSGGVGAHPTGFANQGALTLTITIPRDATHPCPGLHQSGIGG